MQYDDACLKCSLCISACPVVTVNPAFPGPKALGPEWWRRQDSRVSESATQETMVGVDDCTFCQLCESACPASVPVAHLIAEHKDRHRSMRSRRTRLRDFFLAHPHWLGRMPLNPSRMPRAGLKIAGLATNADFPHRQPVRHRPSTGASVALFVDCYNRDYGGGVVEAALGVLRTLGVSVDLMPSRSSCCGAAAYASGRLHDAHIVSDEMHRQLSAFTGITMLTLNATCDGTIRDEWPQYFYHEIPWGVVPWTEWVLEHLPDHWRMLADKQTVAVHTTCRAQVSRGSGDMARVVRALGGRPYELDVACCGAAGSYAFKEEHATTSLLLGEKARAMVPEDVTLLLVDSGTCALHLSQYMGMRAVHPAVWLNGLVGGSEDV